MSSGNGIRTVEEAAEETSRRVVSLLDAALKRHVGCDAVATDGPIRDSLLGVVCRTHGVETHVVLQMLEFDIGAPGTARRIRVEGEE